MEIRPRRFGECLNDWFRALWRNWKPLLLSSLAIQVPLAVVVAIVFWLLDAGESFAVYLDPAALESMTQAQALQAVAPLLWVTGIWTFLQVVAGVFVYLASSRTVAVDVSGSQPSWREVSRFAAKRTVPGLAASLLVLIAVALVVTIAVLIGWMMLGDGGVGFFTVFVTTTAALTAFVVMTWFGVSVSLVMQVIAMEGAGPVSGLSRSMRLVRGRWWATLGYVLLASLIASAASQVLSLVVTPLFVAGAAIPELLAFAFGVSTILQAPLLAAIGAAYAIWYVDLRSRRESLLAEQLI